uniref:Protein kinase domain-containing protein n=1 Tax=Paramoeba aestuarina TaxID=180227 RepID=A0A7S4K4W4_9EUKA|mmetsp:Transcript_15540/g.24296  ORF Transcript_15540/g.24296 Transcript_15540/m.24296 type:complete len:313 (+) Transcript_15540:130-1068(+)
MFRLEWANQQPIPFRFGRLLGKGKFGEVYEGENRETGEKRALKVLKKCSRITASERTVLTQLPKHPNIVHLEGSFDLGEDLCVFVLELCDTNLEEYIKKQGGTLESQEARMVMKGMTEGLRALRENHIFHRDLKSENIFLIIRKDGVLVPKLGDFGLAKQLTREDELFYSCTGSPLYVAPEIWSQAGYTTKSDIYSCGVVLYEMLTGNPPFHYSRNKLQLRRLALFSGITENDVEKLTSLDGEGKSLLRGLLQKCPQNRIGWEEFFAHPWFAGESSERPGPSCAAEYRKIVRAASPLPLKFDEKQPATEVVF